MEMESDSMLWVVSVACTAVALAVLLEQKYRGWITLAALAAGGVLCWIAGPIFTHMFRHALYLTPAAVQNITVSTVFFVVSLFIFRNSLVQKLALILFSAVNLALFPALGEYLLGLLGGAVHGAAAQLLCSLLYLAGSALVWVVLGGLFHFYKEQHLSVSWVWLIACTLFLLQITGGAFDLLFAATQYWPRYVLALAAYAAVLFSSLALTSAGRFARRKAMLEAREEHLQSKSEYCRSMLVNIESLKNLYEETGSSVPAQESAFSSLFAVYHDNPYVSAVIATYAADAEMNGIRFEYSNDRFNTRLKTMEICTLLTDMLTAALNAAETSGCTDPFIRLSMTSGSASSLVIEAVYSDHSKNHPDAAVFPPKDFKQALVWLRQLTQSRRSRILRGMGDTQYLISRYSGTLDLAHRESESILRVAVHI